jgi:signal transduction histidine kinase
VDNALRYTPRGGRIRVSCATESAGAVLRVADTGPGIPADERDRVFDRFYRRLGVEKAGSGLGLAIVKQIADDHGAVVGLSDLSDGTGLVVTVRFSPG